MTGTPSPPEPKTLGDRIRQIADQIQQENAIQIKATSRILGAAAQLAVNQDRLIDEVVEMVETDLSTPPQLQTPVYTVEQLKHQFSSLKAAKAHFNLTANSWAALATKLNGQASSSNPTPTYDLTQQRLEAIENNIKAMRTELQHLVTLIEQILAKSP